MPTPLDNITETHDGPEPRVLTEDVRAILRAVIRPGDPDVGASVALVAKRADVSPRTVYRVLSPDEDKPTISLGLADDLCVAVGVHPAGQIRLVRADGTLEWY